MTPTFVFDSLRWHLRQFRKAKRGNVILTFALATLPMVGFVGAAVDYSRGNSAKAAMQQAIDATGLILSRDAQSLTEDALKQKADSLFKTLINRPEIQNIVVTPVLYTPQESTFRLVVDATGKVATTFTKIIGKESLDLSVNTEIKWGVKKLELALALDNTGSMSSNNKMTELKKALLNIKDQNGATADGLLETLKKAAKKAGDIKISVIPFDTGVNIGTSFKDESWLDWDGATNKIWGSCNKTIDDSRQYNKTECNNISQSTWTTWSSSNKNSWTGCVVDRTADNDVLDTTPGASAATKFPVVKRCDIVQALPLTDVWATGYQTIKDKINAMSPQGYTNVTIGLAWAWHSLTSGVPMTDGTDPKPDTDKVIILLTDGDNTQNRTSYTQSTIDARTTLACANVKAANIKLYTVRVIDGNASLLQSCATKPEMYFNVAQASQLNPVFAAIAQSLANLRIAK
jgi:Flp pilus assembly protein TadG